MSVSNHNLMDAAMCLWEACLELRPEQYVHFREAHGAAETRDRVASFAEHCHNAWEHAHKELGYAECFDWDWCPRWIKHCVDEDFDLVVLTASTQAQMIMEHLNAKV